jgi:hypothetical protein
VSLANARAAASFAPSEADLRAAFERLSARGRGWPATYEDAMAHPTWSRLVHVNARHPGQLDPERRGHPWPFMASRRHRLAQPTTPAANASTWSAAANVIDLKRAAAGDRDD